MLLSNTESTLRIKSIIEKMDHDTSEFLGSIHQSRLEKLLLDVSDCCSSPTPVTILEVKGHKCSKLKGHRIKQCLHSLADLGDVDLIEDLNEDELSRYFDPSQSTANEAQTKIVTKPASLKVL